METVVNEMLSELIDYEWLSVFSFEKKCVEIKCSLKHTLDIYSTTVREISEKHPNKISQRSIIFSAMLAQERFRHAEHLLAYISSDILLLLSVWL